MTRAHLGLVGEAGPEAIIPLSKARGLGHHVSIDYHPTIHADGANTNFAQMLSQHAKHIVREVKRALELESMSEAAI